jgi:hypothetical protein
MYGRLGEGLEFDFVNPVPEDDEISAQVLLNKSQSAKFLADTGLWEAADILSAVGLPDMKERPEPRTPVKSSPPPIPPPKKAEEEPDAREPIDLMSWLI